MLDWEFWIANLLSRVKTKAIKLKGYYCANILSYMGQTRRGVSRSWDPQELEPLPAYTSCELLIFVVVMRSETSQVCSDDIASCFPERKE